MRLRTLHLAHFLLLLSAIGATESAVRPDGSLTFRKTCIAAVLFKNCVEACSEASQQPYSARHLVVCASMETTGAARTALQAAWTMRPPSAQVASLYAVTGLARA